ncbi:MAG: serine/threonine-protein kinase [Cyanobacteria bacterium P01_A01_bin.84]
MLNQKNENAVMQKVELDIYIGKLLNNRYLIRDSIGKGGMGRVYLAEDTAKGGIPVAVKVLSLNLVNQQLSQRFAREIFIGAQLGRKSKHIVKFLGYGITEKKVPFYVMEYLQGKSLKELIRSSQPLNLPTFLSLCHQICLGLHCAHQGVSIKGEIYPVIHRDIKPENIFLVAKSNKGEIVKILDFGIAKFMTERSGVTLTDSFVGSLPYCSPEHMEGRKLLDVRSDIYSLGILMYEMLARKHPFSTKNNSFGSWYEAHRFQIPPALEEVVSDIQIPTQLQKLVMRCLAKEVNYRPQNLTQILTILEDIHRNPNGDTSIIEDVPKSSLALQLVTDTSATEKICLQKNWPKNKPVAPICFPDLEYTPKGVIPTFWAMLPKQEISKFIKRSHHTEFICQTDLYPMLLWATVLYDRKADMVRWLSYYLDLKDNRGKKILQVLAKTGYYHLLLFALEKPKTCTHLLTLHLNALQRQQLLDWLELCQFTQAAISSKQSKNLLKLKHEKLKPKILQNLNKKLQEEKSDSEGIFSHFPNLFHRFFKLLSR